MSQQELRSCPFCGVIPEVMRSGDGTGTMIECMTAGCVNPHTSYYGKGVAHSIWNRRTNTPSAQAIDELVGALEFYGDKDNYSDSENGPSEIDEDYGCIARVTVSKYKRSSEPE